MPKSLTIRSVPDEVAAELAARAAHSGRSLQEYVRAQLVDLADRPDAETWAARVRARKDATGGAVPTEQILAHLEAARHDRTG